MRTLLNRGSQRSLPPGAGAQAQLPWLMFLSLSLLVVACVIFVVMQRRQVLQLTEENMALKKATAAADTLRAENKELRKLEAQQEELDRLREQTREIHRLRASYQELQRLKEEYETLKGEKDILQTEVTELRQRESVPGTRAVSRMPGQGAWIGLAIQPLTFTPASREYAASGGSGVVVQSLVPAGPAARSGVKVGDIITSIDGVPIETPTQLQASIRAKTSGESVRVELIRGDNVLQLNVKTDAVPSFY